MTNQNLALANCIFAPALTTASFFIAFLRFRPQDMPGESLYLWAGLGSFVAALIGFTVGYRYRRSEKLNLLLRWLLLGLVLVMVGYAGYMSYLDLRAFLG